MCIRDSSNGRTEPDNAWPAFKGEQLPFLSSCGASLKFLFITYMGLNYEAIACLKYHPEDVYKRQVLGVVYCFTILMPTLTIFIFRKINGFSPEELVERKRRYIRCV